LLIVAKLAHMDRKFETQLSTGLSLAHGHIVLVGIRVIQN